MRHIPLTLQSDRLIGYTNPRNGSFLVADHDEVWRVEIAEPVGIEVMEQHPYDLAGQNRDFVGLHFEGAPRNQPLLHAGGSTIAYDFNPKRDYVTVRYTACGHSGEIRFRTFSGDWFCASLSDDGDHHVLAEPYGLALYDLTSD
jgi:hypothetical protein